MTQKSVQAVILSVVFAAGIVGANGAGAQELQGQIIDTGQAYQVKLVRTEAQKMYAGLNLTESWIPGEGGGKAIAKGYGDPTGTFGFVCTNQGEGRSGCVFQITKASRGGKVEVVADEQRILARTSDAATIATLYDALKVAPMHHGGYFLKTLASESLDVSVSCMIGFEKPTEQDFCMLQMLR